MINNLSIQQIRVAKFLFAILKKIPLRMKLMVFMLFLSVGLLQAMGTYGQVTSLTLEARNETVQQVLDKIEAQSEFSFFYNNKQVNVDRLVSINTKNQNVFSILNKLFDGTDVTYKVLDKSIILSIKENKGNTSLQEDKRVSGIVLDEKGEPVIGANVMVKGTTNGTVTDMDGKFVAIKMHFGELGNMAFLRPNYAKAVADVVKELGGKPFLTDCNTMYPGSRKNALEHLECAWENGFTPLTVGCPVIIGDGLKGTDDIEVPVEGGEYVKAAKIGRAVMDADVFISLTLSLIHI